MKPLLMLFIFAALELISCEGEDVILQTRQYEDEESGDTPLASTRALVVENSLGQVIIQGTSDTSEIGWFLDKWVTASSQTAANEVFSQISFDRQTSNDTEYVSVAGASSTLSYGSLLSLRVPGAIPCIVRKVNGTTSVGYLRSSFTGENLTTTNVDAHQGNCVIGGTNGNVSVEMALPDGGLCRVSVNSGDITLKIPESTSSMLSAQTGDGTIFCPFLGDTVSVHHSLTGQLGAGHGNIQLSTGTGNIVIRTL